MGLAYFPFVSGLCGWVGGGGGGGEGLGGCSLTMSRSYRVVMWFRVFKVNIYYNILLTIGKALHKYEQ